MSVEPIEGVPGVSRAKVVCDECGRSEVAACDYKRVPGGKWVPNEGQIKTKITAHNWSIIKNKMFCPACLAKRKVVNMHEQKARKMEAEKPKEPTKKQRVQIFATLAEVYDIDSGRYMQGDTDDTVADVLGVMPGWVAEIREAEFGPDGGNEDIATLAAELAEFRKQATEAIRENTERNEVLINALERAKEFAERLSRIRAAVGPRNIKKAGV